MQQRIDGRKRETMDTNGFDKSRRLMAYGAQFLAGGVSSNFRLGISPTPLVIDPGEGAYVIDAGGNKLGGITSRIMKGNTLDGMVGSIDGGDVAAVIMEPAMCNTSVIPPRAGYLEGVREACTRTGSVLIFDEVITGFRLGIDGAQGKF